MSKNHEIVDDCLRQAAKEPAKSLVRLWLLRRDHKPGEPGHDRATLRTQVEAVRTALESDQAVTNVDSRAALQAVDEHLSEAVDSGHEPKIRHVELSPQEGGGNFQVVPRPAGWISRLAARQPNHVEYWMRRHQVLPATHRGIDIRVKQVPRRLTVLLGEAQLRFAAGGFTDDVSPVWESQAPYWCAHLDDPKKRWNSVEVLLLEAAKKNAAIVVLPELTVDAEVREQIRAWLQTNDRNPFALVAAGSFYEEHGSTDPSSSVRHNVCHVLDCWGDELLAHVKLQPMRVTTDGKSAHEGVVGGDKAELISAPFGLIGVAICLDFAEGGDTPITNLWHTTGPALMMIPSMGRETTNNAHRVKASDLSLQHGTATLVASQHETKAEAWGFCWASNQNSHGRPAVLEGVDAPVLHGSIGWTRG